MEQEEEKILQPCSNLRPRPVCATGAAWPREGAAVAATFPPFLPPHTDREGGPPAAAALRCALPVPTPAPEGVRPSATSVARSLYSTLDRIRRMSGLCWIKESLEYLMGNDS